VTLRLIAACLAAASAAAFALLLANFQRRKPGAAVLIAQRRQWRAQLRRIVNEGELDRSFGSPRTLAAMVGFGALAGYLVLGPLASPAGALAAPLVARALIKARRARFTRQIDAGAADLAQALASALAAGRSIRGALLIAGQSTPEPLAGEVDRAAVDLTIGGSVADVLAGLRARTESDRIEAIAGAIELHRTSGGDLVALMRELAAAFRDRDRALRDAHAASAQARFTAVLVAAIPLVVLAGLEAAAPGAVTGALRLVPTAMMLLVALALLAGGVALTFRIGRVTP